MRSLYSAIAILFAIFFTTNCGAYELIKGPAPTVENEFRWSSYRTFSSVDGLPGNTVNALAQDTDGFVYAATENGVARFEGKAWRKISLPTARDNAVALRLAATSDGAVWIGTDDAGLFRYSHGIVQTIALPNGAHENDIEALIPADAHSVFAGTSQSLYRCDATKCREIVAAHGLQVAELLIADIDERKCLYVGTNVDGLYRIDGIDRPPELATRADWHLDGAQLGSSAIRALAQWGGNDGKDLWVGTGFGLSRISHQTITRYLVAPERFASAVRSLVAGKSSDGSDVLIVGFYVNGLAEVRLDGSWQVSHRANGLPEEYVLSLLVTDRDLRSPTLWIGLQDSGIARRDVGVWSRFDERNGLPHHAIHGLGELTFLDGVRTQWIATAAGSVRWNRQRWEPWLPTSMSNRVVNVAKRLGGTLWIGTETGLGRIGRTDDKFWSGPPLPGVIIDAMGESADDVNGKIVWIGTHDGLAQADANSNLRSADVPPLGANPTIRAIETTHSNAGDLLWIGGDSGIAIRSHGQWSLPPETCRSSDDAIFDFTEQGKPGASHWLWIGSRDGLTRVDLDHGLACERVPSTVLERDTIYSIAIDHSDRLYVFGKHGVIRLTPSPTASDDLSQYRIERFGLDDGLPTLEFNHGSLTDDQGRIWAASVEGAVLYDPRDEVAPPKPRPFRFLSAHLDESLTHVEPDASLRWDENNVAFEFALLSYQRDRLTRYRTELIGSDEPSSSWAPEGKRIYRRLPAGDYLFRAYARDGFGVESEPISMHFSILPPLWKRWWALITYALTVALIGSLLSRWRIERLRRAAKSLELTVQERTASLKEANAQLDEARRDAEAATQSKSVFLANMSHEIRTPMNAVLGFAGLGTRLNAPPKAREYFRKITNAAQNLLNVLNDILDFSKIEAGKLALETVPFSLTDVLDQVTDLFALKAAEKSLEFVVGSAPGLPDQFIGDPLRLGQVLVNLINNAVKFTQAGFVQLYVERVDTTERGGKTLLRFSVEDSGIGMSRDQLDRLFQPFSQADHSTTRHFGGTGLGLTISQRLVAQMGGVITVTSHPGAGSCFQFEIGLKQPNDGGQVHRFMPDELAGLNVLVVDDSAQAREWLRDQLIALRFNVTTVASGEAALEVLRKDRFDLIVMDWMMPGIDGIETTRRIKSDVKLARIPEVIMVSAYGREAIQEAAEHVGVRRFLIKPVNPSLLFDTIIETLGAEAMTSSKIFGGPKAPLSNFAGTRVLLAEDNVVNQQLAVELLATLGVETDVATNGIDAVRRAESGSYAAILMDIEMPEMDGYAASREIATRLREGRPPIIAMTAHASAEYRQRCAEAGMSDFVTKPIVVEELIAVLNKYLKAEISARATAEDKDEESTSAIDTASALARMRGNIGLLKRLIALFADSQADVDESVRASLDRGDWSSALRGVHSLCGAAGNIGATRLHAISMQLEDAIERRDNARIEELYPAFSRELRAALSACGETASRL